MPGNTRQTLSHRSSLIAAGTRIEGTVVFAGALYLRGEIRGDVSCDSDSGTLVVDAGGTLTGSADAPHIVVRGRLVGPMQAAQTIEIAPGGATVGGASYRSLAIAAGGVVDGPLTPLATANDVRPQTSSRPAPPPTIAAPPSPRPRRKKAPASPQSRSTRNLALAITAVLIVVATLYWTKRDGSPRQSALAALPELVADAPTGPATASGTSAATPEAAAPTPEKPAAAAKETPASKASPRASKPEPAAAKAPPAREAAASPVAAAEKKPAEPAERPEPDADTVFAVKGVNAEKPSTTIYVITREPVVIYKKMPDVTGKGTRLAFSRGRNTGIRIAPDELLRVAQGEDLDLYYQGGKVWANPIESGTWMRFEAIEPPPPAPKPAPPATASAAPPSAPAAPAANQPAATPKAAGG